MYVHLDVRNGLDVGYYDVEAAIKNNAVTEDVARSDQPKVRLSFGPHGDPDKYWWFKYDELMRLLELLEEAARLSAETYRQAGLIEEGD